MEKNSHSPRDPGGIGRASVHRRDLDREAINRVEITGLRDKGHPEGFTSTTLSVWSASLAWVPKGPGLQARPLSDYGPAPGTDDLLVRRRRGVAVRVKIPLGGLERWDRELSQHGSAIWAGKRVRAPEGLMGNPATRPLVRNGNGRGFWSEERWGHCRPVWILRKPQASTDDGWLTDV